MEDNAVDPPAAAAAAVAAPTYFKLAPFWVNNPGAWFAQAEGQFHLRAVVAELDRYYLVLAALPEATVELIADLVEAPVLPATPYTELRRRLLQAHTLSSYQMVEQLNNHPALGDQRPSELLAAMLKRCPRGHEDSPFFFYLFLHRLPRELRVLLADMDPADRRALSERADHLWSHNVRGHADVAAAVPADQDLVAAVRGRSNAPKRSANSQPQKQSTQHQFQPQQQSQNQSAGSGGGHRRQPQRNFQVDRQALLNSGLCFYHYSYGKDARRCEGTCSWQEN